MSRDCDHCHTPIEGDRVTLAAVFWPNLAGVFAPLTQGEGTLGERVDAFTEAIKERDSLQRSIAFSLDLHPDCYLAHYRLGPQPVDKDA